MRKDKIMITDHTDNQAYYRRTSLSWRTSNWTTIGSLEDLQNTNICVAGDVSKEFAIDKFTSLESCWKKKGAVVKLPEKYNSYQSSKL